MNSAEFPPKSGDKDAMDEATRLAIEEIGRKLAGGIPLSPSEQARSGVRGYKNAIEQANLRAKESEIKKENTTPGPIETKSEGSIRTPVTPEEEPTVSDIITPVSDGRVQKEEVVQKTPGSSEIESPAIKKGPEGKLKKLEGDRMKALGAINDKKFYYTKEQFEELDQLSDEELKENLERLELPTDGERKAMIRRLLTRGFNKIELEPIEDYLSRDSQKTLESVREEMGEKIEEKTDDVIRKLQKKIELELLAHSKAVGVPRFGSITGKPLEPREHQDIPVTVQRLVTEEQQKEITEKEADRLKNVLPPGRRRVGFFNRGINPDVAVQVGVVDGEPDKLMAVYETKKDPDKPKSIILTGEKTEREEERRSIVDRKIAGEDLVGLQRDLLKNSPELRREVERKVSISRENEELKMNAKTDQVQSIALAMTEARERRAEEMKDGGVLEKRIPGYSKLSKEKKLEALEAEKQKAINEMGADLLHSRDLTPKQEALWTSSAEIRDRVGEIMKTGKFEDEQTLRKASRLVPKSKREEIENVLNVRKIDPAKTGEKLAAFAIEKMTRSVEPRIISYEKLREDLKKNIPDFEDMDRETQEYLLAEAHKREKEQIGIDNIEGFKKMSDKKKAEALEEYRNEKLKENQFKQDDLLGVEGYRKSMKVEKDSLEAMGIRRIKSKVEMSRSDEAELLAKKQRVEDLFRRMNLNKENIAKDTPGFFLLDEDKQIYVLEKMRQKVNEDAGFDAEKVVAKDIAESGWGGRIWKSMRKKPLLEKARLDLIKKEKNNELSNYKGDMSVLVKHVEKLPYPITYGEDGKVYIEYVSENSGDSTPAFIREFNEAASRLSEIPYEWTLESASKGERMFYEKALYTFESRKRILYENKMGMYKLEKGAPDLTPEERQLKEDEALLWIQQLEMRVKTNQLMTSNPELTGFDDEGFAKKTWMGIKTTPEMEWAAGAVAGYLSRSMTRRLVGAVGGIGASAVLGGIAGWMRKENEIQGLEKKKRHGEKVTNKAVKDFLDLKKSNEKIEYLITRIERAETPEKRDEMREILIKRMNNLHLALEEGRIDPGAKREQSLNRLKMADVVERANTIIFQTEPAGEEFMKKLEEKLERFYDERVVVDGAADIARRNEKIRAALIGVVTVGAAAGVAYFIKDVAENLGSRHSYPERVEELLFEGGDGKWDDVKEGVIQGVPASPNGIPSVNPIETPRTNGGEFTGADSATSLDDVPRPPAVDVLDKVPVPPTEDVGNHGEFSGSEASASDLADNTVPTERPGFPGHPMFRGDFVLLEQFEKENFDITRDASGNITEFVPKDANSMPSVKEYLQDPRKFVDFSRVDLPPNFEKTSWGVQALAGSAKEIKEFLAGQDLLERIAKVDPKSPDIAAIRLHMADLGEQINSNVSEYIKDNAGKVSEGNIFRPYQELLDSPRYSGGSDNLTASLEGGASIDNPIETVTAPEPTPSPETATSVSETAEPAPISTESSNYKVNDIDNGKIISINNEYMQGELKLYSDSNGMHESYPEGNVYTPVDADKYYGDGWEKGMTPEMIKEKEFFLNAYENHKAILESGVFQPGDQYYEALKDRMDYSHEKIKDLLDHESSLGDVEVTEETTGMENISNYTKDVLGGQVSAEITPTAETYHYDTESVKGDLRVTIDPETGEVKRFAEDFTEFPQASVFDGNPDKFLKEGIKLEDMASKFSDNPGVGKAKFLALLKDYARYETLLEKGGINPASKAGKWMIEEMQGIDKVVLKKTGQGIESILRASR